MRERAVCFGPPPGLVGVLCEPEGAPAGAPDVLLSNVGLNHHVGPSRGWVELGRALATHGYASLRFDLSGLGDSPAQRCTSPDAQRAVLDTRAAMDFLHGQRGTRHFVLVANCSGVDSQQATALGDARVAGAVAIDGYAYRNRAYYLHRAWQRLTQLSRWRRRLRLWRLAHSAGTRAAGPRPAVWLRDLPSRARFAADLALLTGRDVRLLFVFTGGVDSYYNYREQFHDMFGYHASIPVLFYPRVDHLFSKAEDRQALNASICAWMAEQFPRSA